MRLHYRLRILSHSTLNVPPCNLSSHSDDTNLQLLCLIDTDLGSNLPHLRLQLWFLPDVPYVLNRDCLQVPSIIPRVFDSDIDSKMFMPLTYFSVVNYSNYYWLL